MGQQPYVIQQQRPGGGAGGAAAGAGICGTSTLDSHTPRLRKLTSRPSWLLRWSALLRFTPLLLSVLIQHPYRDCCNVVRLISCISDWLDLSSARARDSSGNVDSGPEFP